MKESVNSKTLDWSKKGVAEAYLQIRELQQKLDNSRLQTIEEYKKTPAYKKDLNKQVLAVLNGLLEKLPKEQRKHRVRFERVTIGEEPRPGYKDIYSDEAKAHNKLLTEVREAIQKAIEEVQS